MKNAELVPSRKKPGLPSTQASGKPPKSRAVCGGDMASMTKVMTGDLECMGATRRSTGVCKLVHSTWQPRRVTGSPQREGQQVRKQSPCREAGGSRCHATDCPCGTTPQDTTQEHHQSPPWDEPGLQPASIKAGCQGHREYDGQTSGRLGAPGRSPRAGQSQGSRARLH